MPTKKFTKLEHPLGWTDKELQYMVNQNTLRNKDGSPVYDKNGYPKIMNMTVLYRLMGYKLPVGGSVPGVFRERMRRLQESSNER